MSAVAVVESALQAMALREAITAGVVAPDVTILARGAIPAVGAVMDLGTPQAFATPATGPALARLAVAADLVLGDPFSSLAHLALVAHRPGRPVRVVLLEDGSAAMRAWRLVADGSEPLTRAHGRPGASDRLADVAARRLARLAARGAVTVCSALPMAPSVASSLAAAGIEVVSHDFAWSRHVPVAGGHVAESLASAPRLVLGSALAADGHIDEAFYRGWLGDRAAGGPGVFAPHRRDAPWAADLAAAAGMAVAGDVSLPVELVVRDVPADLTVETLPSTAALTIAPIRAPRVTAIRATRLPADAWSADTPASMIELVDEVATLADGPGR